MQGWVPPWTGRGMSGVERPASWGGESDSLGEGVNPESSAPIPLSWGECLLELCRENHSLLKEHRGGGHLEMGV